MSHRGYVRFFPHPDGQEVCDLSFFQSNKTIVLTVPPRSFQYLELKKEVPASVDFESPNFTTLGRRVVEGYCATDSADRLHDVSHCSTGRWVHCPLTPFCGSVVPAPDSYQQCGAG